MTGGGFSGSVVALVPSATAAHIDQSLVDLYDGETGCEALFSGALRRCKAGVELLE
jgi:galactokinase